MIYILYLFTCRIVPVFSDLDARGIGSFEGENDLSSWVTIHENDEATGINYHPPSSKDGTTR